jgi:hypothetical protein
MFRAGLSLVLALAVAGCCAWRNDSAGPAADSRDNLRRAKTFLAVADYKRAIEACQRQVEQDPSAESYVYLTYVYQAVDGYLEHLAKTDQWLKVEQLYLNLATRDTADLVDPPSVLARIAKEIIQGSVRDQSDVASAMAVRLDKEKVNRLWQEQTAWRSARPEAWWFGVPEAWGW